MRKLIPIARLAEAATMRRSTLYTWMLSNHDMFKDVVAKAVRPNWKALATEFAASGLTDADGKAPSDETTRQTWWKVRKTVAARQASAVKRQSTPAPAEAPAPLAPTTVHGPSHALPIDDPDDDQPDLNSFVKERR